MNSQPSPLQVVLRDIAFRTTPRRLLGCGIAAALVLLTAPAASYETSASPESGIVESDMSLAPLDGATPPGFFGIWEPYVGGKWLNFDLVFTNGGDDIELLEAEVVYRDAEGAPIASVTVGSTDLAFAVIDRDDGDAAFDENGGKLIRFGSIDNERITDLAFDPEGRLVLVGHGHSGASIGVSISTEGFLGGRFDAEGELDDSFDNDGLVDVDLGHTGDEGAFAVVVDALSQVTVAGQAIVFNEPVVGESTRFWAIARLDVNGNPDDGFGTGGTAILTDDTAGGWIEDLARDGSSRLLAVGTVEINEVRRGALSRITLSGEVDDDFGFRIATSFLPPDSESIYTGVALDSQDRIYVSGCHGPPQELDVEGDDPLEPRTWFVARFQENGLLDTTFAPDGVAGLAEVPFADFPRACPSAIAIDSEDRIVTVGGVSADEGITMSIAVIRHLPSGELDLGFSDDGGVIEEDGVFGLASASDLAIDLEDRILVAIASLGDFAAMRIEADGDIDDSFGDDGFAILAHPESEDQSQNYVTSILLRPDGRIMLAGRAIDPDSDEPVMALMRLTEDGRLDTNAYVRSGVTIAMAFPDEALHDDERIIPFAAGDPLPATVDIALEVSPTGGDEVWTLEWTGIEPSIYVPAVLPSGEFYRFPLLPPENLLNDEDLRYKITVAHELRYESHETHHRRTSGSSRFAYDIAAIDTNDDAGIEEDEEGEPIDNPGNAERYIWGLPVIAIADGDIVGLDRGQPDNPAPDIKLENVPSPGNFVKIDHGNGVFSKYFHMQADSIPDDFVLFPCSPPDRCSVEAGDPLGVVGNSGNSSGPHLHFTIEDDNGEALPPFFDNIVFGGLLQTNVSLHSGTVLDEVIPSPSEIVVNPPTPTGDVDELEVNDAVEGHHALSLPTTVSGAIGPDEAPTVAVRGDPIEDIYRIDLDKRGQLRATLASMTAESNLDLYVVDDSFVLLNEGREGWGPDGNEEVTLLLAPGAYYVLVTRAPGAASGEREVDYELDLDFRPYAYEYAAKVVCGVQPDREDMRLARGFYATTVNIHRPGANEARLFKKLALAYPPAAQKPGKVLEIGEDVLAYDQALKTDCLDLRERLFPGDAGFPTPYIEGFVIIQSTERLDVTAVYSTADLGDDGVAGAHSSIDVESVPESELGVDLRIDKQADWFSLPFGDSFAYYAVLYEVEVWNDGPAVATDVQVDDSLEIAMTNAIGFVVVLPEPIDLPPGAAIENIEQASPHEVTFDLALGDIAAGSGRTVRFWAVAAIYRIGSPPEAYLTDTATIGGGEAELLEADNTVTVETQLLP